MNPAQNYKKAATFTSDGSQTFYVQSQKTNAKLIKNCDSSKHKERPSPLNNPYSQRNTITATIYTYIKYIYYINRGFFLHAAQLAA